MTKLDELRREQERAAFVQQLLIAVIEQAKDSSLAHEGTIQMLLNDAWEELRLKPTALSVQDLDTLGNEVNRFLLRKALLGGRAAQYERMLKEPYFARVDFQERGAGTPERIVIGLYSLQGTDGTLVVHDWRAPVAGLYYDATPGPVSYHAPSGEIEGIMSLKRQYRFEEGKLTYYVDTDVAIEDEMLMDILKGATSARMRSIVSTIQREQNQAIRAEGAGVLSVIGGAGSGKTSVAMHRAAYLLYRHGGLLDASSIATLSPTSAFSEYISNVLPDLGEENTRMPVLHQLLGHVIGTSPEPPLKQTERLSQPAYTLRRDSVGHKSGPDFVALMDRFIGRFSAVGPVLANIAVDEQVLITRGELERMYRSEFRMLNPFLRLTRIQAVAQAKIEASERSLQGQYEKRLSGKYKGRDLEMAARMAVSQRLAPAKALIRRMLRLDVLKLYAEAVSDLPEEISTAAQENADCQLIWWEDAPAIAYLMLKLGFAAPDRSIRHLLVDEVQDYSMVALAFLHLFYPLAQITLLGDPNQRTGPGMPPCRPAQWGACFGSPDAPVIELSKCYRSTAQITRLCNALLPVGAGVQPFGRDGAPPLVAAYDPKALLQTVERWQSEGKRVALITRALPEASALAKKIKGAWLIQDEADMMPETGGVIVSCYHLLKGLEFDAVAVVWPEVMELTENERRRLYTACSRALHELALMGPDSLIRELGIVT